jgi:tetratricopeptide (TPR) repeat protein
MKSIIVACSFVAASLLAAGGGAIVARANAQLPPSERALNEGTSLIVAGKFAEAEPPLRRALAIDPNLANAHYNLGVSLRHQARLGEAIAAYRAAADGFAPNDEPNRSKALYGAALAADDTGDPELATRAWRDYVAFDRQFEGTEAVLAIAQRRLDASERNLAELRGRQIPGTQKATR